MSADEKVSQPNQEKKLYGYLVEFDNTNSILNAAGKTRDAGYKSWDVHTPFPVHGMDTAMGIKATKLPWIVLGAGSTGATVALLMQWWTNAVNYPFLISGKPLFSLPANIPIIFELTVLFSAIAAVVSMFVLNGFPQLYHPVFTRPRFRHATTDKFFLVIEADDPRFDPVKTPDFLNSLGGTGVERIED